jgi:2-dehydropantoate 2-reductase
MRQVPQISPIYAIIGDGRVARHFCHYFQKLGISFGQWARSPKQVTRHTWRNFTTLINDVSHVLLLLSDDAIEPFIKKHPILRNKMLVHFSGSLRTKFAYSAHPLMTFGDKLYSLETYQKIPFILEKGSPSFKTLLPGLKNKHFYIDGDKKAFYHSLCVLSGNFTCILWEKFLRELEQVFDFPKEIAFPYLEQTMRNIMQNPDAALTGPLVRRDKKTIAGNLHALRHDPYQKIYQSFVNLFEEIT